MKINKQNKKTNEVSISYEKNNSITINIFNNEILMEVFGAYDSNIKELEKLTNSDIFCRGNSIMIKGNRTSNEKVKDAIEYLIDRYKIDKKIDKNDIISSLNKDMINDTKNSSIIQPLEEVIKTPIQKREISRTFALLRKPLPSLLLSDIRTAKIGIDRYRYEYLNPKAKANGKKAILL